MDTATPNATEGAAVANSAAPSTDETSMNVPKASAASLRE
jgi:hypothetical protein